MRTVKALHHHKWRVAYSQLLLTATLLLSPRLCCLSKMRKIKHLQRKRGKQHYRGQKTQACPRDCPGFPALPGGLRAGV